jgi:aspartate racemase
MKKIMIIGGMGPQVSAAFYKLLIDKAARRYGAADNEDFPSIILQSLPVPDFISSRKRQEEALAMMREAFRVAVSQDPIAIGMTCNTAHLFAREVVDGVPGAPFVSMIETVTNRVKNDGLRKVGLIATPTTIKMGLYERPLLAEGIECLVPSSKEQSRLEAVIRTVIAGEAGSEETLVLREISQKLLRSGAESVIFGCTELSLLAKLDTEGSPRYDGLELLADELLSRYYRQYAILESI